MDIEKELESLKDIELTPGGQLAAHGTRFLESDFPSGRRRAAEQDVRRFVEEGLPLLRALDYARLPELIDRLWKRHAILMHPVALPGEPAAWSAADQIKQNLGGFSRWGWEARLVEHIQGQLKPGEKIISIEPRAVVTGLRTWTRAELKAACRYATERSDSRFEQQFLTDHHIDQLIAAESARSAPPSLYASANRSAMDRQ